MCSWGAIGADTESAFCIPAQSNAGTAGTFIWSVESAEPMSLGSPIAHHPFPLGKPGRQVVEQKISRRCGPKMAPGSGQPYPCFTHGVPAARRGCAAMYVCNRHRHHKGQRAWRLRIRPGHPDRRRTPDARPTPVVAKAENTLGIRYRLFRTNGTSQSRCMA